jgi:hypothetical protein
LSQTYATLKEVQGKVDVLQQQLKMEQDQKQQASHQKNSIKDEDSYYSYNVYTVTFEV